MRLTVRWKEFMVFNGRDAYFRGGVQAIQENSDLKCDNLQVKMDRPISVKEGQKDTQTAKVENIVCALDSDRTPTGDPTKQRRVTVLERVIDQRTGQLIREQKGEFRQLDVDNVDGITNASGPGFIASFSKDSADPKFLDPKAKKPSEQTKLTRVEFSGKLWSTVVENTRKSKFYDNVEVYHLPADDPDIVINRSAPPRTASICAAELWKSMPARSTERPTSTWKPSGR